ncbi:hypothetical protein LWI28_025656 [Acer negundo]|uniref:Uncharacterized protein n=1 Tax=Acer negundo TaxID=4023 RepID=A0AAD5IEC2_ACENE|nr:hypothetical protein LWI28_025656 [Acer negundo]
MLGISQQYLYRDHRFPLESLLHILLLHLQQSRFLLPNNLELDRRFPYGMVTMAFQIHLLLMNKRVEANDSYSLDSDKIHELREVFTSPEDESDLDGQEYADINTQGQDQWQCDSLCLINKSSTLSNCWEVSDEVASIIVLPPDTDSLCLINKSSTPSNCWEVSNEVASMIVLPPDSKRQAGRPKEIRTPFA